MAGLYTNSFVDVNEDLRGSGWDIHLHTVRLSAGAALLHELFDRQAEQWPDRPALEIPPGTPGSGRIAVTYGQLAAASRVVEERLQSVAQMDAVVATLLPRTTVTAFAAPVGILRAGCAFTCIDSTFPDVRVTDLIDDSQAVAILTDAPGRARLCRLGVAATRIIVIDDIDSAVDPGPPSRPSGLTSESLAYL